MVTNLPLKQVISKIEKSGRFEKWTISLGKFSLDFEQKRSKKSQVIANFLADFPVEDKSWDVDIIVNPQLQRASPEDLMHTINQWRIIINGSIKESIAISVVIITTDNTRIQFSEELGFPATNNDAEYEAILMGLQMAFNLHVLDLTVFKNSLFVLEQFNDKYKMLSKSMTAYLNVWKESISRFANVDIIHFCQGENRHADALAYLSVVTGEAETQTITISKRDRSTFESNPHSLRISTDMGASWIDPSPNSLTPVAYRKTEL
ncbi:Rvt_3 domain-containing protein [Thalictrum thalictroides]|uniref:Rvt_3 domain-containing protein n=1 Tax=Thalictrum thalictroides TaxID=46969 RepID=A0A7J6W572_THATH|nr:Rvt_3 domain-containing protein [Thalictrum thalictroides]